MTRFFLECNDCGRYTVVFSRYLFRLGRDFGSGYIVSHEVCGVIRSNLPYLPLFPPPPPPSPPHLVGSLSSVPRSGGLLVALVLFRTYTRTFSPPSPPPLSLFLFLARAHLSLASGILTEQPRSSLVVAFGADSRTFSAARGLSRKFASK